MKRTTKIDVGTSAREKNEAVAEQNRALFRQKGLCVMNMIGSPGCGKTSILEYTARNFEGTLAIVVGDVKTALDAERIAGGGIRAVPIETGGTCHLTAQMVRKAVEKIDLDGVDYLFVENVGNLVCPSALDLGEDFKIAVLSVPEGDDKVRKYPALFVRAQVVFINKTDLLGVCDYDVARVKEDCRKARAGTRIFEISARTGAGFQEWFKFLEEIRASCLQPPTKRTQRYGRRER